MGELAVPKVTVEAADACPLTPSPLKPASVNNGKAWKGIPSSHLCPVTAPGPVKRQMGLGNFKEAIHR